VKEVGAFHWQKAIDQVANAVDQSIHRERRLLPQQRPRAFSDRRESSGIPMRLKI
jgi:hypothetical protein